MCVCVFFCFLFFFGGVLVKGSSLSYHSEETLLIAMDPYSSN